MGKDTKNKIVPSRRFPEFINAGDWERRSLGQLIDIKGRIGYRGYTIEDIVNEGEGAISLSPSNIDENGSLSFEKSTYISWAKYEESPEIILEEGFTVLVKTGSTFGKTALIKNLPTKSTINPQIVVLKPTDINSVFLFLLVSHSTIQKQINETVVGGAIPTLSQESISKFEVLVPPDKEKKEQQKIADCLSSLDDLITAQNQKFEALKAHKKGLMQQLFPTESETVPKLRFAQFRDSGEWKEISFIEVADKNVKWSFTGGPFGSNLKASDYVPDGIRVIQLQNIGDGEFNDGYKIFTSEEKADELLSCNIYPGNIILSKMGDPVGRACLIPNTNDRYVMCSDGIRLVVNEKRFSKYFIYSLINSNQFRRLVEKTAMGSTRKRIGLDDLKKLPMMVPDNLKEQQKIADCFLYLDGLIAAQTKKIDKLKRHKKGLMQELFPANMDSILKSNSL